MKGKGRGRGRPPSEEREYDQPRAIEDRQSSRKNKRDDSKDRENRDRDGGRRSRRDDSDDERAQAQAVRDKHNERDASPEDETKVRSIRDKPEPEDTDQGIAIKVKPDRDASNERVENSLAIKDDNDGGKPQAIKDIVDKISKADKGDKADKADRGEKVFKNAVEEEEDRKDKRSRNHKASKADDGARDDAPKEKDERDPSVEEKKRSRSRSVIARRGKNKSAGYRVRIENLPVDISEEELKDIGSDWGKVDIARVWSFGGKTYGNLVYDSVDEAMKALVHLYGRRIAGCEQKLKAQIPCPHCEQCLWE